MKYFVKHGKKDGSVEIDLYTGENSRPQTIKRLISAENNRSEWKLNGVSAKEQQVIINNCTHILCVNFLICMLVM